MRNLHLESSYQDKQRRWRHFLETYGPLIVAYLLATFLTRAYNMGDTLSYTDSIAARIEGRYDYFWEFGHLLWRPLAWLVYRITKPLTRLFVGNEVRFQVTLVLMVLTWVWGLVGVIFFTALMRLFCKRQWVAITAGIAFIGTNAVLNYLHTGCPYVPALSCALGGLYVLLKKPATVRLGIFAGLLLACAVCFWLPFVLTLPAVFLTPLLLEAVDKGRIRQLVLAIAVCASAGLIAYLSIGVLGLGLRDLAGFRMWYDQASHGLSNMGGTPRAIFGLARSFINMGEDGRIFKRYVVHDPFSPVSLMDLFRLSLWKVGLFYTFLAVLALSLVRSRAGRRILLLNVLNAVPLFVFAIFLFDAGQIERYLPLYPLLFVAITWCLCSREVRPALKYFLVLYLVVATVTNIRAMSLNVAASQQRAAAARTQDLKPLLKTTSKVFTSSCQDEMVRFRNNLVFDPSEHDNQLICVVDPNTSQVLHWQKQFATTAAAAWQAGGDVWIANRMLTPRPRPEWNWVEGDDPRVSWKDIYQFFSIFSVGQSVGGEDGFSLLLRTPENQKVINEYSQRPENEKAGRIGKSN